MKHTYINPLIHHQPSQRPVVIEGKDGHELPNLESEVHSFAKVIDFTVFYQSYEGWRVMMRLQDVTNRKRLNP